MSQGLTSSSCSTWPIIMPYGYENYSVVYGYTWLEGRFAISASGDNMGNTPDGQSWNSYGMVNLTLPPDLNYGVAVSTPISGQLVHVNLSNLSFNGTTY